MNEKLTEELIARADAGLANLASISESLRHSAIHAERQTAALENIMQILGYLLEQQPTTHVQTQTEQPEPQPETISQRIKRMAGQ